MSVVDYLSEISDDKLKYTQNEEEVHMNCPICDESRHRFYVSLQTHQCYCHNCGFSSSFIGFIQKMEKIPYEKAIARYKEINDSAYIPEDVLFELRKNIFMGDVSHNLKLRPIPLPEEYIPLNFKSKNPVMRSAIKYLMKRKIGISQMKLHDFGICLSGEYENRIIIPIEEFKEPKFFVGRAIGNKARLKEKSPSNESYQISKSQVIFNIDNASSIYNKCVISEGVFDALSFGDIGVSLLGKRMSDYQLSILLDYKDYLTGGVYIALDWDARKDAIELASRLNEYFPVYLVNMPKGNLKKGYDPNEALRTYGRKYLMDLVDNAEEYSFSYHLKRRLIVC